MADHSKPNSAPATEAPKEEIAGYRVHTAAPWTYKADERPARNGQVIKLSQKEAQRVTDLRIGVVLVAVDKDGKRLPEDRQPNQPAPPPVTVHPAAIG